MKHIMLDIETLDTCTTAVVVSIGAVAFNPGGGELGERLYIPLARTINEQLQIGRTINGHTLQWWMKQSPEAQAALSDNSGEPTVGRALTLFSEFVIRSGGSEAKIWGYGADFDNMIVGSLYGAAGVERPWSYRQNRCLRTMKDMAESRGLVLRTVRSGTHHNALDDAVTQAQQLQEIYTWLRARRSSE